MSERDAAVARQSAHEAAQRVVSGADAKTVGLVVAEAERAVIRQMLSWGLAGGEAEFWRLVEEEIKR